MRSATSTKNRHAVQFSAAVITLVTFNAVSARTGAQVAASTVTSRSPAPAHIVTRWAHLVSPTNALPAYPRPQMVRREWMNLNGLWQFAPAHVNDNPPIGKALAGSILVPYPVESTLSGVGVRHDNVWYRRHFTVPAAWRGRRLLLHFGAVNWDCEVWLNGKALQEHKGGYDGFDYDVTSLLKASGQQELVVWVFNPADDGSQPRGKQVNKPGGIFYTPSTGIWQTVWLEPVEHTYVQSLKLVPDVDRGLLHVTAVAAGDGASHAQVTLTALEGTRTIATAHGPVNNPLDIRVTNSHLWSPGHPYLYNLKVTLQAGGQPRDEVSSYFAMRKVSLGKVNGITRIMLNGKFVFEAGVLDQGFWPDGIYTAPTDDALRYDIVMAKKLGLNMIRKHVKVEPERWYYWADRLGILVWQDMPSSFQTHPTPDEDSQFQTELTHLISGRGNHPSIVLWVVFNEGWGQHDTPRYVRLVRHLDPTRLVNNASGWTDMNIGDVHDMHKYPAPGAYKPEPYRASVLGEFGGLGLPVPGHMWEAKAWGYKVMSGRPKLTSMYQSFMKDVYRLQHDPGLSATVYTQLTDVETESNGLMTYDRAIVKPDLAIVAAANQGRFLQLPPAAPVPAAVLPTAEDAPVTWKYTVEAPAEGWQAADFDDTGWTSAPAPFGRGVGSPRTDWRTADIWLRRTATLPANIPAKLSLYSFHDEDVEVYINGVLAGRATGYNTDYAEIPMLAEGRAAIKAGENVIAVHTHQTVGGQYIDVGIVPTGSR